MRVVVVDDDVPTRVGITAILTSDAGIEVVGEGGTGAEAIELCRTLSPDIVIMDVRLPDGSGIAVTARILEDAELAGSSTRVIVLTTLANDRHARTATLAGASAFVVKRAPVEELLATVRHVAAGSVLAPRLDGTRGTFSDSPWERPKTLSDRESDVLALIARGRSNEEIAEELFVSLETVRSHVKRVYDKIGARHRADAVALAYESGMVRSPRLDRF
jgi:DNA-binding NarL/FixJ family response regulator